ncbi:hypothetical protein TCAL_14829 [Tigriopus californicus]|uniref:Eclosion hormone n=1 Tax=Tigriopus californicus TaxID=6832 RepID=A0A553PR12_TIGCA|nr:hypothetical protein TCAL_14829 [Tigriopus californicus]
MQNSIRPTPSSILLILSVMCLMIPSSIFVQGSPRSTCLRSCHLCQQMYGDHFQGHLCAHTCIKLRGRVIPDCTNFPSIAPYLDLSNLVEENSGP